MFSFCKYRLQHGVNNIITIQSWRWTWHQWYKYKQYNSDGRCGNRRNRISFGSSVFSEISSVNLGKWCLVGYHVYFSTFRKKLDLQWDNPFPINQSESKMTWWWNRATIHFTVYFLYDTSQSKIFLNFKGYERFQIVLMVDRFCAHRF